MEVLKSFKSMSEKCSKIDIFTFDKYLHVTHVISSIFQGLLKYSHVA